MREGRILYGGQQFHLGLLLTWLYLVILHVCHNLRKYNHLYVKLLTCLPESYRLSSVSKNCLPKLSTKKLLNLLLSPHKEFSVHLIQLLNFRFHFASVLVHVSSIG